MGKVIRGGEGVGEMGGGGPLIRNALAMSAISMSQEWTPQVPKCLKSSATVQKRFASKLTLPSSVSVLRGSTRAKRGEAGPSDRPSTWMTVTVCMEKGKKRGNAVN